MISSRRPDRATPSRGGLGDTLPALLTLAAATFTAVTTEMTPIGLLPEIGREFGTSEARTGLLVTVFGLMVALFAVPLTLATRRWPPKTLLLGSLAGYLVSSLLIAFAPTFPLVAAGRVIGGLTHALFYSISIGVASRIAPPGLAARALAVASAGASAGFVLGVPLGTSFGHLFGWRATFVALALLAGLLVLFAARTLPALTPAAQAEHVDVPAGVQVSRPVRALTTVAAVNAVAFLAHFGLYTYIAPLFLSVGVPSPGVGPLLFAFGGVGVLGLAIVGRVADAHLRPCLLAALGAMTAAFLLIGAGFPSLGVTLVASAAWGTGFGTLATLFQTAAVRARPGATDLAGAWINSTANVGIGAGAALGGLALDATGLRGVTLVAAGIAALAAVMVLLARSAFPTAPRPGRG